MSQCNGWEIWDAFYREMSSHSTALLSFFFFFFLCAVFSCFHTKGCEAHSLQQMDMESLTCTHIACCMHEGESGTYKSARVDWEGRKKFPSPCPARGMNPGSSDLNSDSLTTELRPWSYSVHIFGRIAFDKWQTDRESNFTWKWWKIQIYFCNFSLGHWLNLIKIISETTPRDNIDSHFS